jgi:hypothetical protein
MVKLLSVLVHNRRLSQENGGWALETPSPSDLVAAGFFYAPLPGIPDRVACHACGKVTQLVLVIPRFTLTNPPGVAMMIRSSPSIKS